MVTINNGRAPPPSTGTLRTFIPQWTYRAAATVGNESNFDHGDGDIAGSPSLDYIVALGQMVSENRLGYAVSETILIHPTPTPTPTTFPDLRLPRDRFPRRP